MPAKQPEDLTPEALEERNRALRLMESHKARFDEMKCDQLFSALFNKIQFGADPADPDYKKDWLIP